MENAFELNSQVTVDIPFQESSEKPKRSAFVFITTESNNSHLALENLKKIAQVKEVYVAHGAYDIVAKLSGESFEELRQIVQTHIRLLNGIKSTLTLTLI